MEFGKKLWEVNRARDQLRVIGADADGRCTALSPDGRILDTVSTERHNNRHDENEDVPDGFEPERIKSSGR